MSSYSASPNRQRFLAKFEGHDEGYLYRRTPAAVPVRISAKDHKFMVDAFDRDWSSFLAVTALAAAITAFFIWVGISRNDWLNSHALRDFVIPVSALWLVGTWYADLWDIPDRALFQRARDMGRTQSLPWLTKTAGDLSWKSTTIFVLWGLPLVDRVLVGRSAKLWDKFFFVLLIFGVTLNLLAAIRKVQLNRSRSLPYLNEVH